MNNADARDEIRSRFLGLTGLRDVQVEEQQVGPETFLRFKVARAAPIYRRALAVIDREIGAQNPFHGRLSLEVLKERYSLHSRETEALQSLITRSLRVTSDIVPADLAFEFAPFAGGEEQTIAQPANHVILGRRGVGKSSLILLGVKRLSPAHNIAVWIDFQPYRGRNDPKCVIESLRESFQLAKSKLESGAKSTETQHLVEAIGILDKLNDRSKPTEEDVQSVLPRIRQCIRSFTLETRKQLYIFLDDAHLLSPEVQPFLFDAFHSVLKGAGGWLNIAGVRNLTRLYDASKHVGLQTPHDAQPLNLDLTLTDPRAARDHLVAILEKFLAICGIERRRSIISGAAVERLVWCSAGVPRDFLWLFQTASGHALQNHRSRVGVQEVNLAVGEYGQSKMQDLVADTTEDSDSLKLLLENLRSKCLDELRSNSFLVRHTPQKKAYDLLQKLMDLRLIHLVHPSITPGKAGEKYEAYLLDYSFYTGVRRRHRLSDLHISSEAPPRYAELRTLPKIDLEALIGQV